MRGKFDTPITFSRAEVGVIRELLNTPDKPILCPKSISLGSSMSIAKYVTGAGSSRCNRVEARSRQIRHHTGAVT
jgi:hypothetical protein